MRKSVRNNLYFKDKFILKANQRHLGKYDYSQVEYINSIEKVKIICPDHGPFWVRPDAHVRKVGCPVCNGGVKYNISTFISKANILHKNKYDYSEVEYINSSKKVKIICPIHSAFFMRPANHLSGQECPSCSGVKKNDTQNFILLAKKVHLDRYDYTNVDYKNNRSKVEIICKTHGNFLQNPKDHINGHGCKLCNFSRGELMVESKLKILDIEFIKEKKFEDCVGIGGSKLPFDFYLPKYNIVIEFDGRQHYEPVDKFGGEKAFDILKKNDERREIWCRQNNIKLFRIKWNNIENTISELYKEILSINKIKNNQCINIFFERRNEFIQFFQSFNEEIIIDFKLEKFTCDIFLPNKKIGFKFLGLFRDSELNFPKNRQLSLKNQFFDNSLKIVQIFEDQWEFKKDIIKCRIRKLISPQKRIFARKCQVKEIFDNKLVREFIDKNHIQGFIGSKIKLGLFLDNELISLMIFGNLRKNLGKKSEEGSYEMLRFCTKLDNIVIGGASKIFQHFIKKYQPNSIISYADKLWSDNDNMYQKIGMKFESNSKPSYFYVVDGMRKNRFLFRKDRLISQGFDSNLSEHEICKSIGLFRIYDCGTFLYSWSKNNQLSTNIL